MKQRIPINSITSKLVLKSMYASCSTGPFFADHYSNRFEKTQLKFRQEKWLPVKISCIIWNEICKKKKLIKNRNGIFCQKFLIFLKSLKSLNKNFYWTVYSLQELSFIGSIYSRKEKQRYFCQDTYFLSPSIQGLFRWLKRLCGFDWMGWMGLGYCKFSYWRILESATWGVQVSSVFW